MISRNFSRRLEHLEEHITPETVPKVWQIVIVHPEGRTEEDERIEWKAKKVVERRLRLDPKADAARSGERKSAGE
jgi:hypothetical protein